MLAKRFEHILHDLGMAGLEHPLFYHAPVGIRFKIGGEEPIYLDRRAAKLKTNPAYVQGALDRAAAIYRALPAVPDLLRIDGYPDEEPAESLLTVIRQRVGLPVPDEQLSATEQDEDGDTHEENYKWFMPFVNKLETLIKNLTIQCVRLKEEVLQLRKEKKRLSEDVEFYKGKIKDMSDRTELLQEKADDLERVKRYAGAEQIDTIIRKVKEQERTEQQIRRYDRSYGTR